MDLKKIVTKFFEDVPKSVIGIDIGSGNIKIAQVDLSGKRPVVTNAVSAELPVDMVNNGFIRMAAQMTGFMKNRIGAA